MHDTIQHRVRVWPELTALCKFGRSMQVRRLRTVPHKSWKQVDFTASQGIVDEVNSLQAQPDSPAKFLGLAVLGVESDGLEKAMALLSQPRRDESTEPLSELSGTPVPVASIEPQPTRPERQSGKRNK